MKITVKENRKLVIVNPQNTQNENEVETIELSVPTKYEDWIKKIVFVTDDAVVSRLFVNNLYTIEGDILQYDYIEFYIWLTNGEKDFRSETKTLIPNLNKKLTGQITPAEKTEFERIVDILDTEILKVENMDIDATKVVDTTTITITDKNGNEKSVEILDGKNGKDGTVGRDGVSPVITETPTQNGYDITITDVTGTNTITLTNGKDGVDGVDGISPTIIETQTQNGYDVTITDKNGTRTISLTNGQKGDAGADGQDGYTPIKGTDYFTTSEIEDIEEDILENIDVKPQVFYWDGSTNQTALDLWNEIYELNKTTDIIVIQKVSDIPFIYLFTKNWNFTQYNKALTPIKELSVSASYDSYYTYYYSVAFVVQNNVITSILKNQSQTPHNFIDANKDYSRPFTPSYDGSPATKKYVDDTVGALSTVISSIEGVVG